METDENRVTESSPEQTTEMSEAEIDKTLNESFPASDPPSWTLGTDHREERESARDESGSATEENSDAA